MAFESMTRGSLRKWKMRDAAAALAAFTGYVVAGKLGLGLAMVHPSATAVWAPAGIALATLLILGLRAWPVVFLGAFLVNITTDGSVLSTLGIAAGNTLEAVVAAGLLGRFAGGRRAYRRGVDVLKATLFAGLLSTTVSATIGVLSLSLTGYARWSRFEPIWFTWWLGDAGGMIVVAPVIVLWANRPRIGWSARKAAEGFAAFLALVIVQQVVFGSDFGLPSTRYPLEYLAIPILVWVAVRFEPREAATASLVATLIATLGTIRGRGPFEVGALNQSLLLLGTYAGVVSVMILTLAAEVAERRRMEAQRQSLLEEADRALRARDDFLAVAGHELRTPLNAALLVIESVRRQIEGWDPQRSQADPLARMHRSIERIRELVDELLDVSRISENRLRPEIEDGVNLAAILRDVVDRFREDAERAGSVLELRAQTVVGQWDPRLLDRIACNLVGNAIKYGNGKTIEIDVEPDGDFGHLRVRDHGIGIAPEDQRRIFRRFERAASGRSPGGLGLGLWITERMVRALHGTIELRSEPGRGAAFSVRIPLLRQSSRAPN